MVDGLSIEVGSGRFQGQISFALLQVAKFLVDWSICLGFCASRERNFPMAAAFWLEESRSLAHFQGGAI
jgi:hypothetical protein